MQPLRLPVEMLLLQAVRPPGNVRPLASVKDPDRVQVPGLMTAPTTDDQLSQEWCVVQTSAARPAPSSTRRKDHRGEVRVPRPGGVVVPDGEQGIDEPHLLIGDADVELVRGSEGVVRVRIRAHCRQLDYRRRPGLQDLEGEERTGPPEICQGVADSGRWGRLCLSTKWEGAPVTI